MVRDKSIALHDLYAESGALHVKGNIDITEKSPGKEKPPKQQPFGAVLVRALGRAENRHRPSKAKKPAPSSLAPTNGTTHKSMLSRGRYSVAEVSIVNKTSANLNTVPRLIIETLCVELSVQNLLNM